MNEIECNVCGYEVPEDGWNGVEMAINPDVQRDFYSIEDLDAVLDAYYTTIPTDEVDGVYSNASVSFDVPKQTLNETIWAEMEMWRDWNDLSEQEQGANQFLAEQFGDRIGEDDIHVINDTIYHFMYRLRIEDTTDEYKNICAECYEVMFD